MSKEIKISVHADKALSLKTHSTIMRLCYRFFETDGEESAILRETIYISYEEGKLVGPKQTSLELRHLADRIDELCHEIEEG